MSLLKFVVVIYWWLSHFKHFTGYNVAGLALELSAFPQQQQINQKWNWNPSFVLSVLFSVLPYFNLFLFSNNFNVFFCICFFILDFYVLIQPTRYKAPPSLNAQESMWREILYYAIYWYTTTLDVPLQIVVNSGTVLGCACISTYCEYYSTLLFSHLTNCVISVC